jgi:hypothetical protein
MLTSLLPRTITARAVPDVLGSVLRGTRSSDFFVSENYSTRETFHALRLCLILVVAEECNIEIALEDQASSIPVQSLTVLTGSHFRSGLIALPLQQVVLTR